MKRGFTLIEIMIALAILAIVGTVSVVGLYGTRRTDDLNSATQEIAVALRQAQSNSMSQSQNALWGIHFDNTTATLPFYSIFYSANGTYASGTVVSRYPLPSDLCYSTSSIGAGSSTDIIFGGVSGAPSTPTSITFQLMSGGNGCTTATSSGAAGGVSRGASGEIFFDDFNRSNL